MLILWLACATDETQLWFSPHIVEREEIRSPLKTPAGEATYETALGLHLCTRIWVRVMIGLLKKPLSICQSGWKEILKRTSCHSLSPLGGLNKDTGAALQTLLTEVKLHLWRRLYGGAIPVLAAFVFARVYPQGLEGSAMATVWVPWLLVIQTENWQEPMDSWNWSVTSSFSDPLLMLSTIRCWTFLHSTVSCKFNWIYDGDFRLK